METRFGGAVLPSSALTSWAAEASAVVTGMLRVPGRKTSGEALLARADHLLDGVRAAGLADGSDLLPSGLTRRFAALAAELRAATAGWGDSDPDSAIVTRDRLARVARSPDQLLATAAPWTSPWLPPGYEQNFWNRA